MIYYGIKFYSVAIHGVNMHYEVFLSEDQAEKYAKDNKDIFIDYTILPFYIYPEHTGEKL